VADVGFVHAQQIRENALLIDWWRTFGWQKSSTPTLNSSTKSLAKETFETFCHVAKETFELI